MRRSSLMPHSHCTAKRFLNFYLYFGINPGRNNKDTSSHICQHVRQLLPVLGNNQKALPFPSSARPASISGLSAFPRPRALPCISAAVCTPSLRPTISPLHILLHVPEDRCQWHNLRGSWLDWSSSSNPEGFLPLIEVSSIHGVGLEIGRCLSEIWKKY